MQPFRQPLDHAADHGVALVGALARGRRDLLLARTGGSPLDASERVAHEVDPWRVGRSGLDQRAPGRRGLPAVAVLLGGKAEEIARMYVVAAERDRFFE